MIRTQDIPEDNDRSRNRSHRCENKLAIEKTPVHAPRAIDETVTIERLIALGEEQGQVKFNDVMLMFPQVKENLDLLEDVYDALLSAGIPYSDNGLVRRTKQGKTPAEEGKPGVNLGAKSHKLILGFSGGALIASQERRESSRGRDTIHEQ